MKKRIVRFILCPILLLSLLFQTSCCGLGGLIREILSDYVTINLDNAVLLSESTDNEQVCTFEIFATVTNDFDLDLEGLTVRLTVPENVQITGDGDRADVTGLDLSVGEAEELRWIVRIPKTYEDQYLEYRVSAFSAVIHEIEAYAGVFVRGKNQDDNRLNFSRDTWSFRNFSTKPVCLTQRDYDALVVGLDHADAEALTEFIKKKSGGYCYGFAASSILARLGVLNVRDVDPESTVLHDVKKTTESKSVLAYYWLMQCFPAIRDQASVFLAKTTAEQLDIIQDLAEAVETGGSPVLISFYSEANQKEGHAVVGYAREHGSFQKDGSSYDSRIMIYDSNSTLFDEDCCLYYNEGTDEWCIPHYPNASGLKRALADPNLINIKNLSANRKSANSYLQVRGNDRISLGSVAGDAFCSIDGVTVEGSDEIVAFRSDGLDDVVTVAIPNTVAEDGLIVRSENGEALDVSISFEHYYMHASTDSEGAVVFDPTGSVRIEGNAGNFALSLTADEGYYTGDWYTAGLSGRSGSDPSISVSEDGFLVGGEELKTVDICAENDDSEGSLRLKKPEHPVVLDRDGDHLRVKSDDDGDGLYETILKSVTVSALSSPLKAQGTLDLRLCALIAGGVIVVGGGVVLAVLLYKRKQRPTGFEQFRQQNGRFRK